MRALLLTAAFTGLRASELRGLRWEDVDMKAAVLQVRQRADRYNKIGKLKSAKSRRTIPLDTANLLPALRQWHMASEYKNGLVFPTSTGASRAPQEYGSQPRAGHEGGQGREQKRQAKICPARLPPLLCKLVPEHRIAWRPRASPAGRATPSRAFINRHDARRLWPPIPRRGSPQQVCCRDSRYFRLGNFR